jgi:hypothetical protein
MTGTGREIDLSRVRPGYRARIRNPLRALGSRRLMPRVRSPRLRPPRVARQEDLSETQPSTRADVSMMEFEAWLRYFHTEAGIKMTGPSRSPQGFAITAVILTGAGVLLGCGALITGCCCGLPLLPGAAAALAIAAAPLACYFLLRRADR